MSAVGSKGWHVNVFHNVNQAEIVAESKQKYCLLIHGDLLIADKSTFFADFKSACWRALQDAQQQLDSASDRFRQVCKRMQEQVEPADGT